MDWLEGLLGGNAVVTGGAALALFGLLAVWLRDVPGKVVAWGKHFFVSTLTVDSRDELMFPALVEYMDSREALRRLNNFTARAVRQSSAPAPGRPAPGRSRAGFPGVRRWPGWWR